MEVFGTASNSTFTTVGSTNFFGNGVMATNRDLVITSEAAAADNITGDIIAEGDVIILDRGHMWRGTNAVYNSKTGEIRSGSFKSAMLPFNVSGEHLVGGSNEIYSATNAIITTDDYATPIYRIHARTITIAPGHYIEARDATLYMGSVPIFYFPYYHRALGKHPNNLEFVPGYRSSWGPFLLGAFNWYGNGLLDGTIHVDEREARGVGVGPDLLLHLGDYGEAAFRYYYLHDHDSTDDGLIVPHLGPSRQRMSFFYQDAGSTNFSAKVVASYQSDPLIVRDFYESEYRQDVQPSTFAEANQLWPNYTIDVMGQTRLVNFFETVERLPDVKLTGLRQQVGVTPVFYENESSIGYFRRDFSETNNPSSPNYSATRADTFHQFTLPETFFGWLNVTPRVGGRLTYYGDVSGPAVNTNAQGRGVFNTGVDFSFKASRVYSGAQSAFWDVNELRHIIEPDINYAYVPAPSRAPSQLPQFDNAFPSLALLPIEYPDYNSIDSIDKQNVLRLTLRNKLQTKRAGGVEDLLNLAVYTDWNLTPGTNHIFSDLFTDLALRPRTWLVLDSTLRYDLADHRWREAISSVTVTPDNTWSMSLSYRYLMNNDPEFQAFPGQTLAGHNLFTLSTYYRVNENWGLHLADRFEAQNGTLQEQDYSIYRDLRSWTASLVFRVTQGEGQPSDYTVAITMSLKAFPRFRLGTDSDRPNTEYGTSSVADSFGSY